MLVADAKARIAMYGSAVGVHALSEFPCAGSVLDSPERASEFTAVCQKMRSDTRPRPKPVADRDVHFLLFSTDIDSYLDPRKTRRAL